MNWIHMEKEIEKLEKKGYEKELAKDMVQTAKLIEKSHGCLTVRTHEICFLHT